jgi:hypothetical protein
VRIDGGDESEKGISPLSPAGKISGFESSVDDQVSVGIGYRKEKHYGGQAQLFHGQPLVTLNPFRHSCLDASKNRRRLFNFGEFRHSKIICQANNRPRQEISEMNGSRIVRRKSIRTKDLGFLAWSPSKNSAIPVSGETGSWYFSKDLKRSYFMARSLWANLNDAQLLAQCELDTYRASGPGGQKRNKTSSAVRIRHLPSALIVIAEESRSQHENRVKALKRLRQAFYLELRETLSFTEGTPVLQRAELVGVRTQSGKLEVGRKDVRFWPLAGLVLDVLETAEARVSEAAKALEVSTGNLIDFLETDPKVWAQANQMRLRYGHKALKTGG